MARLAFFGTPSFSVPFLLSLNNFARERGHDIVLVVTQADQRQGRGQQLHASPVKEIACKLQLPIAQPTTLRKNTDDGDLFFKQFHNCKIDLAIVVAYGKIITERLLSTPPRGFLNVHASLLPRFRGAAPIQRAIEAGDTITGVALMDMVKGLDEGDLFAKKTTPIIASDTSSTLFRRLSYLGSSLLVQHLDDILAGQLKKIPQSIEGMTYASMLTKEEGHLDFLVSGAILCQRIRAFDPWPGAYVFARKKRIKLFDSFFIPDGLLQRNVLPGTIVVAGNFLGIKTIDGVLYVQRMQIEGKKILPIKEANLGFGLVEGEVIGS